eukprot:4259865-Pyramimonas_sp.AAC.1
MCIRDSYRHDMNYVAAHAVPCLCRDGVRFGVVQVVWQGSRLVVHSEFQEFDEYVAPWANQLRERAPQEARHARIAVAVVD